MNLNLFPQSFVCQLSLLFLIVSLCQMICVAQPARNKFDHCANQTYECIENASKDEQHLHCCCQEVWSNCRRSLNCDAAKKSNSNSCQYLLKQERVFSKKSLASSKGKDRQCSSTLQCPNAATRVSLHNGFPTLLMALFVSALTVLTCTTSV